MRAVPYPNSMLRNMQHLITTTALGLAWAVALSSPAWADDAGLQLAAAYPFDTGCGWNEPQYEFHWPDYAGMGMLVHLETSGYDGLRDVRLLLTAESPTGGELLHRAETLRLSAGSFEYLAEDLDFAIDPFSSEVVHLAIHAVLEGGPEVVSRCDATFYGVPAPEVQFSGLRFHNPARKQNLTRLFPGDEFVLEGEVFVEANPTPLPPVLYIGGVLLAENEPLDLHQPATVNALNWGRVVLDAPAGAWRFTVQGRLPRTFPETDGDTQPLQFVVAVRWSPSALTVATLDGEVLDPGLGFEGSRVPNERLIIFDPAWEWEIAPTADG